MDAVEGPVEAPTAESLGAMGGVMEEHKNADEVGQDMEEGLPVGEWPAQLVHDGAMQVVAEAVKEEQIGGVEVEDLVVEDFVEADIGVDRRNQEEAAEVEVEEVKQHAGWRSSSKEKEVIYISDEESSDSSIKPDQGGLRVVAPLVAVKAEPLDEDNTGTRLPDVVKLEPGTCELQAPPDREAPEPMLVPKAEVIYGTGVLAPGDDAAASREVALAKVAAEWEQFGGCPGITSQEQQQALVLAQACAGTGALSLALSPTPLAVREPALAGDGTSQPALRAGIGKNPNIRTTHEGPRRPAVTVGSYTVQCCLCHKWRWVPNKQVYEHIREMNSTFPFRCEYAHHWWPDCSCDKPAEISVGDVGFVWAMDKSNISRPPSGWERKVVIRGEGSLIFSDVYYLTPDGRTMRSMNDIVKFLADHPQEDASLAQFNFSRPRPMDPKLQRKRRQELLGAGTSGSPAHKCLKN